MSVSANSPGLFGDITISSFEPYRLADSESRWVLCKWHHGFGCCWCPFTLQSHHAAGQWSEVLTNVVSGSSRNRQQGTIPATLAHLSAHFFWYADRAQFQRWATQPPQPPSLAVRPPSYIPANTGKSTTTTWRSCLPTSSRSLPR